MIIVTGATGGVGRPLLRLLVDAGERVRAITRQPAPAGLPAEVDVVVADLTSGAAVVDCLADAQAILINPRAVGDNAGPILARAVEAGVTRAVVLSAINVEDDRERQPSRFRGDLNAEVEAAVIASGLEWTSLRSAIYASNMIGLWASQIRSTDVVYGPYAEAMAAPIVELDVAAVAAAALRTDQLLGQRVELTGPDSLSQRAMLTSIGEALGRELAYHEISPDAAREAMMRQGFPAGFADAYLRMLAFAVSAPTPVTDSVSDVLGRDATSLADWAAEHADAFRSSRTGPEHLDGRVSVGQ
ncbi:NAD(P)H-binding protein [Paenarthrobacter sp. PH39-S1]|uniref:NAD(P)H-binding protein n=1 Tax=Paenarthrobacter sp. PH39-S1 TaxID=3046204 RepID=UPI0024BA4EC6|nr:NAD(P)H-binding protein [Paenarthrobacter sp. PH39-S1]MDJ0356306.1 NAD(P)H-binding protein [Paenarthrobacter sp. PH39-S1]